MEPQSQKRQDAQIALALAKSGRGGSAGAGGSSFVYREGYVGPVGPVIFPTFAGACAAAAMLGGAAATIVVDSSLGQPQSVGAITIPENLSIVGQNSETLPHELVNLIVRPGSTWSTVPAALRTILITNQATAPVCTVADVAVLDLDGMTYAQAGTAVLFDVPAAGAALLIRGHGFIPYVTAITPGFASVGAPSFGVEMQLVNACSLAPGAVTGAGQCQVIASPESAQFGIAKQATATSSLQWTSPTASSFLLSATAGLTGPVVWSSWTDLFGSLGSGGGSSGPIVVQCDDGTTIPAGTYDTSRIELRATAPGATLTLADGVQFTGTGLRVSGGLTILNVATAAPPIQGTFRIDLLDAGCRLLQGVAATQPFMAPAAGAVASIDMAPGSLIVANATPIAVVFTAAGTSANVNVGPGATVDVNAIAGSGGAANINFQAPGAIVGPQPAATNVFANQKLTATELNTPSPMGVAVLGGAGSQTILNPSVNANTRIALSYQSAATGVVAVTARVPGNSFTITSAAGAADAGAIVFWQLWDPAFT